MSYTFCQRHGFAKGVRHLAQIMEEKAGKKMVEQESGKEKNENNKAMKNVL